MIYSHVMQDSNKHETPIQTHQDMMIPAGAPLTSTPIPLTPTPRKKMGIGGWIGLIILLAIFGLGIWAFITTRSNIAEREKLIETGLRAEGTATGRSNPYEKRISKYARKTVYNAYYRYTKEDGTRSGAYGDKDYDSADDIKEGMKATIHYYDEPGSDTAVTNEE